MGYDFGRENTVAGKKTKIIYTTDFYLLEKFAREKDLKDCCCIMIDEAHERTINTDILLFLLRELCTKRKNNLKVIITSATIDYIKFLDYFNASNTQYIHVPGRLYPVDVVYDPLQENELINDKITNLVKNIL